ncbi:MAG: hypothetical protein J7L20_03820 [Thermoplasmata archaeon]|nr:hypothetical protein [Thermoplasmata archaeon]
MTRRKVLAEERKWKCPICNYQRPNIRWLALHLAMKRDEKHKEWRKERGLPIDYRTRRDAQRIASKVEEIIFRNQREYMWR